jgi:ubiquinone biosynthesis protein
MPDDSLRPLPIVNSNHRHHALPQYFRAQMPRRVRRAMANAAARQRMKPANNSTLHVRLPDSADRLAAAYQRPGAQYQPSPVDRDSNQPVIRSMARRVQAHVDAPGTFTRPQFHLTAAPRIGPLRLVQRLGVYLGAILYFVGGTLIDKLRRRDTQARRAVRLRRAFERVGGTFVKIGQQMASRLDLLPLQYCEELANMLDHYPAIATEQAIAVIERTTGKRLEEIFSTFDPEPIGSASIACVYQAVLRETGETVAVKVRRPGIRELFEADFRVLDLLGGTAEALTLVRPGLSLGIREEFRNALGSELDFHKEARIQETFERRARKAKLRFFSAPRIHPQYCNDEVIVQDFSSGMWMYEVLAGIEQNDPVALARMAELNIDPRKVARRLLFMSNWSVFEGLAFHADPHPANIVVRANSHIVFIDFGASGYFDQPRRDVYVRMYQASKAENVWEMARMGLAINEPLPPMDINAVTRELEKSFYNLMLAMKSKSAPWYERTSATSWINAVRLVAKHHINTPPDLLMYARSTLLYDTLAARLDPSINFYKIGMRYFAWAKRGQQKRGRKALRRIARRGLLKSIDFQQIEQTATTFNSLLFRLQRLFSAPYDFTVLPFVIEKWIFVAVTVIRFVSQSLIVTGLAAGIGLASEALQGQPLALAETLQRVVQNPIYLVVISALAILHVRLILFRLEQKTTT